MDNSYITQIAPYFGQQDQGLTPVFQNINAQQAFQNQNLQQGTQLAQQAGQTAQNSMAGLNPLAMAAMLRNKGPGMMGTQETPNWNNPYANYNSGATIGSSGIE
jgi:polyhydroxyalkanoate synthesis regulator protein